MATHAQSAAEPPMTDAPQDGSQAQGMHEAARRAKLRRLAELGHDPWGHRFDGHAAVAAIRARENEIESVASPTAEDAARREQHGPKVRAAGRVMLHRKKGKLQFITLQDHSGRVQIMIGRAQVGEDDWALSECVDLGDLIGVDGELKKTNTGELTIFAEKLHFLTKSVLPHPEKHHGIADPELRQRRRYLDLIHTDGAMERFIHRAKITQSIRATLAAESFVEIEGPTLHTIAGGAAARPFKTHHNALDIPLVLRIALELHLKRLLVGGVERVYELGRVYRNEGISQKHNPEFTMLEVYQAYGDYRSMMDLTEKLIAGAIAAIGGASAIAWGEATVDWSTPFERMTYDEAFARHAGAPADDAAAIAELARREGIETAGKHADVVKSEVFEALVEDKLAGPVFIMDYPASICPLTKRKAGQPHIAERFELYVQGMELANAYTELNDPDLQEQLFRTQLAGQREEDSMARMDDDFIRALRYGMPPAGGLGIGIDRLVMLLTSSTSIRDVILFPLLRPETD